MAKQETKNARNPFDIRGRKTDLSRPKLGFYRDVQDCGGGFQLV